MAVDSTSDNRGLDWDRLGKRAAWAGRGRFVPKIDAESHAIGVTGNYYH